LSIEAERLLAMCYDIQEKKVESEVHHRAFFQKISTIEDLFDPVAKGVQRLHFSRILQCLQTQQVEWEKGINLLSNCLGTDHPWIENLQSHKKPKGYRDDTTEDTRETKRVKL
jgi:hypothetical protein